MVLRDEGAYRCVCAVGTGAQRGDDAGEHLPDVATAHALLHGGEERVWGDAGYQGVGKREESRGTEVDRRWR